MVSGSISLPCSGFFSPFLHSTGPLSVSWEYLALPGGPGWFWQDSSCPAILRILLSHNKLTCTSLSLSMDGLSRPFQFIVNWILQSYNPDIAVTISVWASSISLAATLEIDVSFFSSGYLDVSVHRVPFHTLWIGVWMTEVFSAGFPHSDISGSMDICSSPKLFAAYHVLHRLLVPRHPPCALIRLTTYECIALHSWLRWHFSELSSLGLLPIW